MIKVNELVGGVVAACCRHWRLTIVLSLLLGVGASFLVVNRFAIDTDAVKLLSPDLPWRKREQAFDKLFPQKSNITAIIIDGATPQLAEKATRDLTAALRARPDQFHNVYRPDGGPYFDQNGLMLLSKPEVEGAMQSLIGAQFLLGSLAADPSLRGLSDTLSMALQGVQAGQAKVSDFDKPFQALAGTLEAAAQGRFLPLNWQGLISGGPADPRSLRHFILVQPRLDYSTLTPGAAASDTIRALARDLGITPDQGLRLRLTGDVPMADEEFGTLAEGAAFNGALTGLAVLGLLWLAVRSFRIVFAILVTVVLGLAVTAAFGLLLTGPFNLLSIAFTVLFVGLGVDFGIQFSVRYRAERLLHDDLAAALTGAGLGVGRGLAVAAAATAAGFLAFLPTDYRGVSQLGQIAGFGMVVAFGLSVTLLPALLMLLRPRGEHVEVGWRVLAPVDDLLVRRRGLVLAAAGVVALGCAALLPRLTFDFNPLNLRSPKTEAVSVVLEMMKNSEQTPMTIDVLADNEAAARALADKLSALPEVAMAVTLDDYIPTDQDAKLAIISDAATLLGPTLAPLSVKPAPTAEEVKASLRAMVDGLAQVRPAAGDAAIDSLTAAVRAVLDGSPDKLALAEKAIVPGLTMMLAQVNDTLSAQPVTLNDLPADMKRDWIAADGHARVQVFPKGDANDNATIRRFVAAVRTVAPDATGAPISIQESSATIIHAFTVAGVLAVILVTLLLVVTLRRISDVLKTLAPLFLAALLTLAASILVGQPINFANIIALPLLFGIGTAFNIYYVVAWRQGHDHPLSSSLTRAIVLSALTTGTAFGSLWTSHHPGTASMGELLVFSLVSILLTSMLFLTALLGPAPKEQ